MVCNALTLNLSATGTVLTARQGNKMLCTCKPDTAYMVETQLQLFKSLLLVPLVRQSRHKRTHPLLCVKLEWITDWKGFGGQTVWASLNRAEKNSVTL